MAQGAVLFVKSNKVLWGANEISICGIVPLVHNQKYMKLIIAFFALSIFVHTAKAQYYYKDIVSCLQAKNDLNTYKTNKVRSILIKSIEGNGEENDDFFAQKKISKDYKKAELFARNTLSAPSLQTSIYSAEGFLIKSTDSSDISVTSIYYSYNDAGMPTSITSIIRSSDDDFTNEIVEQHLYSYSANGIPEKMARVKNHSDTVWILFAPDEKGNVAIEKDSKTGTRYYYYYDNKGRLTDIVQENDFKKQMRPDYVFEYNSQGQISQMTSSEEGLNNYYVWKYYYENGLRIREKCFNKERKLMGSIEYEYK